MFVFDWFKPSHCDKCSKADRTGNARFWELVADGWSPQEVASLNEQAKFLAEED